MWNCDIIIPTFNRKKFEKLISDNINSQDYPFINKIIIGDDGDDAEKLNLDVKYNVEYHKIPRCTIGFKRNYLMDKSKAYYICMMDTDDYYQPSYISKSIFNMIYYDKIISGSSDMIIYDNNEKKTYLQRCMYSHLLNEATMIFKNGCIGQFNDSSAGEGNNLMVDKIHLIHHTDINDIMVCIAHANNTVNKSSWFKPDNEILTNPLLIKKISMYNI